MADQRLCVRLRLLVQRSLILCNVALLQTLSPERFATSGDEIFFEVFLSKVVRDFGCK